MNLSEELERFINANLNFDVTLNGTVYFMSKAYIYGTTDSYSVVTKTKNYIEGTTLSLEKLKDHIKENYVIERIGQELGHD